jgi:hypothetical protein
LAASTTYSYTVAAYDVAGNTSAQSAQASGTTQAAPAAGAWVRRIGSTGTDRPSSLAVDGNGDIVYTGSYQGSVDFGGGALPSAGGSDIFIAKYSAAGAYIWSKRFGGPGDDVGGKVALDANGNVFIASSFTGTVDFGGGPLTSVGAMDIVVAKYSAAGVHQWSKRFGNVNNDTSGGIAIDGSGNVLVTGSFVGNIDFGGGTLWASFNGMDTFVLKLSPLGAHIWSKNFVGSGDDSGLSVAVDASGNVFVAGNTSGSIDFGGGMLANHGTDWFLVKLAPSGAYVWSKMLGGVYGDQTIGIALDSNANIFAAGTFVQGANYGGGDLTSAGGTEVFLAKYASDGSHLWSKSFAGSGDDRAMAVAADAAGNVSVTGTFMSNLNLGGSLLSTPVFGRQSIFVGKFSANGTHIWSEAIEGSAAEYSSGIQIDRTGYVVVGGGLTGTATFGTEPLTSAGDIDAFLLKLDP